MNERGQTMLVSFPLPIILWMISLTIIGYFWPNMFSDIWLNTVFVLGLAVFWHIIFFSVLYIYGEYGDKK
jgi:hypothetical protein